MNKENRNSVISKIESGLYAIRIGPDNAKNYQRFYESLFEVEAELLNPERWKFLFCGQIKGEVGQYNFSHIKNFFSHVFTLETEEKDADNYFVRGNNNRVSGFQSYQGEYKIFNSEGKVVILGKKVFRKQ